MVNTVGILTMVDLNPLHDPNNEDLFIAYLDLHVVMDPIKFYHRDKVLIITWIQKKETSLESNKKEQLQSHPWRSCLVNYWMMAEIRRENQLRLVVYPIIYKVLYIPGGAGFQPSTVWNLVNYPITENPVWLTMEWYGSSDYMDYLIPVVIWNDINIGIWLLPYYGLFFLNYEIPIIVCNDPCDKRLTVHTHKSTD